MKNNCRCVKFGRALVVASAAVVFAAACASRAPAPVDERNAQLRSAPVAASAVRDTYTVKSGDTLYSIARDHGMDFRELIAMNAIDSPDRITPGRVLKVKPQGVPGSIAAGVASTAPITLEPVFARPLASNTEGLKREPKGGKEPYSDQALALAEAKPADTVLPRAEATPELKPEVKPENKPAEPAANSDDVVWMWPAAGKLIGGFSEGGSKGVDIAGKLGDPVVAAAEGKVVYSGTGLRGYGKLVIIKHNNTYLSAYAHNNAILVKEGQSVTRNQKIAEMGNTDADRVKLHFEVRRQGKPVDPLKYLPQP